MNEFPFSPDAESTTPETAGGRDKRALALAGGLLALLAAGGFLLLSGGDGDELATASSVVRAPRAAVSAMPAASPSARTVLPAKAEQPQGRNPFGVDPEYQSDVVPVADPAVEQAGVAPAPATTPDPGAAPGTVPPQGTTPATAPATATPAPSTTPAPVTTYPLTLRRVSGAAGGDRSLVWLVDGTRQRVVPAQRFGRDSELVVLKVKDTAAGPLALLQVGGAEPHYMAVGATVEVA